jgi:hypothetical protein
MNSIRLKSQVGLKLWSLGPTVVTGRDYVSVELRPLNATLSITNPTWTALGTCAMAVQALVIHFKQNKSSWQETPDKLVICVIRRYLVQSSTPVQTIKGHIAVHGLQLHAHTCSVRLLSTTHFQLLRTQGHAFSFSDTPLLIIN